MILETIQSPADVRRLSLQQTQALAGEIRQTLIDTVAHTGGHLASNLGAVELTLALHRVLGTPRDRLIFDVGHQSYTHKLITGRRDAIGTIRCEGGLSGFPKRAESPYDTFETGHASTALSAALGIARARDLADETYAVAAVVGDGALTGGMCYEALNDAGSRPTPLIVVLNDNEMSIAKNVGALSKYLTQLRGSKRWQRAKHAVKRGLLHVPLIGEGLYTAGERIKRAVRRMLVPGEFFEALGFAYLGPIDGHDIPTLERAIADARAMGLPVVLHTVTQKGRGYALAERKPEQFHGVAPFFVENGKTRASAPVETISGAKAAGDALVALAREDARIVAITAAMEQGTGMDAFARALPERFFDVGIAEEHAMTMAAGFAAAGMRPVFAVYASFLTRACDQLMHDVCLQKLPVTVLVDHAGFVPGDGATHQGIYDVAMLRAMPGLTVWTPLDAGELAAMLRAAVEQDGPCVIRYGKALPVVLGEPGPVGRWRRIDPGRETDAAPRVALVGYGHSVQDAVEAAQALEASGIGTAVWSASSLSPLDADALRAIGRSEVVAILEEARIGGGLGEALAAQYAAREGAARVVCLGAGNDGPGAHSVEGLLRQCGLDARQAAARIREALDG